MPFSVDSVPSVVDEVLPAARHGLQAGDAFFGRWVSREQAVDSATRQRIDDPLFMSKYFRKMLKCN